MGLGTTSRWVLKDKQEADSKQGEGRRTLQAEEQVPRCEQAWTSEKHKQNSSQGEGAEGWTTRPGLPSSLREGSQWEEETAGSLHKECTGSGWVRGQSASPGDG